MSAPVSLRNAVEMTPELLRRLLRYDQDTGKLYWRPRTPDMFRSGYRSAEGNCANWNAQNAEHEALSTRDHDGYLYGPIFKKKVKAHRAIFCMVHGYWPTFVDHIDGAKDNNRIGNLRDVSVEGNNMNLSRRADNKSGNSGVFWDARRNKWLVRAKRRHVGRFDTKEQAVAARAQADAKFGFHKNHGRAK